MENDSYMVAPATQHNGDNNHIISDRLGVTVRNELDQKKIYSVTHDISDLVNPRQSQAEQIDRPLIHQPPEPSPFNKHQQIQNILMRGTEGSFYETRDRNFSYPSNDKDIPPPLSNYLNYDSSYSGINLPSASIKVKKKSGNYEESKYKNRNNNWNQSVSTTDSSNNKIRRDAKKGKEKNRNAAIIAGVFKGIFIAITISVSLAIYHWRDATTPQVESLRIITVAIIIKIVFLDIMNFIKNLQWFGVPFFAVLYSTWTTLLLPGEFLVLASGFIFASSLNCSFGVGLVVANLTVFAGLCLGGSTIFLLTRYYFPQKWIKAIRSYDICRAVILAIEDGGIWFLLLFRASPLVPFQVSNIILGISNITYFQWLIGLLGTFPATISSTFIGSQFREIKEIFEDHNLSSHTGLIQVCCIVLIPSIICIIVAYTLIKKRMTFIKEERAALGGRSMTSGGRIEMPEYEAGKRLL